MANNSGLSLTLQQLTELLGTVSPVPMGNWNATTPYQKLNTVRYNGATYIAKKQNTGFQPTVTQGWQEVWQVLCYDGLVAPVGNYPDMTVGNATNAQNDGTGKNIAKQFEKIDSYIPSSTSADNQLADKAFVNSSINNMAAFYITYNTQGDAFSTRADLLNATTFYSGGKERVPTQNDYATVLADDSQPKGVDGTYPTTRYSYQTDTQNGTYPNGQWDFQYVVNNTSLTQAQVDAINSGITKELVDQIGKGNVLSVNGETGAVTITPANIGAATEETTNKNLYNLGAYDTYISNGDGTGTITRKTGLINLEELLDESWQRFTESGLTIFVLNNFGLGDLILCRCNRFKTYTVPGSSVWVTPGLQMSRYANGTLRVDISYAGNISEEDFKKDISSNPTYIQYELSPEYQYEEKVIENQPIHTLPQDGEGWLRDEWEKGLNLLDNSIFSTLSFQTTSNTFTAGQVSISTDVSFGSSVEILGVEEGVTQKSSTFTIATAGNYYVRIGINGDKQDNKTVSTATVYLKAGTYSISADLTTNVLNSVAFKTLMLNEGSHPYPYQPYHGGIVRENRVPLYITVEAAASPAQLFGGNWEKFATLSNIAGDIYIWREV